MTTQIFTFFSTEFLKYLQELSGRELWIIKFQTKFLFHEIFFSCFFKIKKKEFWKKLKVFFFSCSRYPPYIQVIQHFSSIFLPILKREKKGREIQKMTDKQTRDYEKFLQRTPKKKESRLPEPEFSQYENENSTEENNFENEVYKEISLLNGQINRMNLGELKNACKSLHLDCYGKR